MSENIYRERARLVAFLACEFESYLAPPSDVEPGFSFAVYIDTPEGQLSWHIADEDLDLFGHVVRRDRHYWDGHSTETKYKRLSNLINTRMGD